MKLTLHVNGLPLPDLHCSRQTRHRLLKYLIAMKLFIATLIISLNVSASVYSQKVNISVNKVPLEEVLKQIRIQTGVYFVFKSEIMLDARPVTVSLKNIDLKVALPLVFKNQPFSYVVQDNAILLKRKGKTLSNLMDEVIEAVKRVSVTGTVTSKSGMPIPGVSVSVLQSSLGTVTDNAGKYKIDVEANSVLRFSYIGYKSTEIAVGDQTTIDVVLQELTEQLDQVQVIGYGTTTRRLSTGNVAVVRSNVISNQPVTNPLQALAGRVAGLQITQTSGLPGRDITVRVRGRNSITANNNPLYIVDGVPFSSETVNRSFITSPLNNISPEDIESISVLKDADATSIYGSRAANGVIMITTKKGKPGKTTVNAKVSTGWSEVSHMEEMMNTEQYLQLRKDALANSGVTPTNTNAPDLLLWDKNTDNKWQEWYMGRIATNTDATLGVSGGTEQTTFLLSGAYHRENTVQFSKDYFKRGNAHVGISHRSLNDRFHLAASAFYTANTSRLANSSGQSVTEAPNYPIYKPDGSYNWTRTNYVAQATAYGTTRVGNLNSNIVIDYGLLPGLNLKASLGYNSLDNDYISISPSTAFDPAIQTTGFSLFSNGRSQTLLFEPQISYSRKIGRGRIDVLGGATVQSDDKYSRNISVLGYTNDLLLNNPAYGATTIATGTNIQYRYFSGFARATYTLSDRYILNGTFRRDGSSRFGNNDKFGNFGSVGAAWIFSSEKFMQPSAKVLSFGKIRGSYGSTGSDGILDYQYLSTYASINTYGTSLAIAPNKIANQNYGWEVNKKLEAAVDLGFIDNRILFSAAWYRNRSGSQLVTYALPSMAGFTGYTANLPAEVQNTGWEFDLNLLVFSSGDFRWDSSINATISQNKLLSFPNLEKSSYANTFVIGQPLDLVLRYHYTGPDPQTGNASVFDANGDGMLTPTSSYNNQMGDFLIAGTTAPKWFGGINNTLTYKGVQLDFFFQYTRQSGYNLYAINSAASKGGLGINGWANMLDYWMKPGDLTSTPKPVSVSGSGQTLFRNSDVMFSNASFLRLKNVMLSYKLPSRVSNKLKMTDLKFFAQGQNLWTVSDFVGNDPEFADKFNSVVAVPSLRNITVGIQANF